MTGLHESGIMTGTRDKDYNLVAFVQSCLKNAQRMAVYVRDAERDDDQELVALFTKAQADSRKGAEIGKKLLGARLATYGLARPAADEPAENEQARPAENEQARPTDVMAPSQAASDRAGQPASSRSH